VPLVEAVGVQVSRTPTPGRHARSRRCIRPATTSSCSAWSS
jgi:hypothetical protein